MAEGKSSARTQEAAGPALRLLVRGLERDERQLLDGLVRVSLRRSPRLEILEEHEAARADVVLIGANDSAAVSWARQQAWIDHKAVIWIGGSGPVPAGHTIIRRPVQWSILPILLARALENGPGAPPVSQAAPLDAPHSTFRGRFSDRPILVVDDSLAVRNHLRSLLEAGGFAVSEADSVSSALRILSHERVDCVLMDVLMPGLDGYEGCRQIKSLLRGSHAVPVVMLTSKSSPFDRIRGKMAGCDAYLTKPIDPLHLGDVLAVHLPTEVNTPGARIMARNILIVEDNPVDRQRLEKLLSEAGYMVATATDGVQAVASARRSKPDAILMDINMPEMDGYAATRALQGDAQTKDIPVLLVSAKNQKADKAWGQMLGAKGYVTKPFSDEQLLSQVRALH